MRYSSLSTNTSAPLPSYGGDVLRSPWRDVCTITAYTTVSTPKYLSRIFACMMFTFLKENHSASLRAPTHRTDDMHLYLPGIYQTQTDVSTSLDRHVLLTPEATKKCAGGFLSSRNVLTRSRVLSVRLSMISFFFFSVQAPRDRNHSSLSIKDFRRVPTEEAAAKGKKTEKGEIYRYKRRKNNISP